MNTRFNQVKAPEGNNTSKELAILHITQTENTASEWQRQRLSSFTNSTYTLEWIINNHDRLVWANNAFKKYFKLNDEAYGKIIHDILPEKALRDLYKKHIAVLQAGSPTEITQHVKLANNTTIAFHVILFPLKGSDNEMLVGGQAFYLPNQYRIKKQLYDSCTRLLLLQQAGTDAIWEWNMKTGNVFRNDTLMKLIGYPSHEPNGLVWWFKRIHPEDRDRVSDKVKEATDKQLFFWEDEYRFKCADGEYKQIHDHGYIIYEKGQPVKMIGSLYDVSKIQLLQNEHEKRHKELSEAIVNVQEIEKAKIGNKLHDNINQILSSVKSLMQTLTPKDDTQNELKNKSLQYLEEAIEEINYLSAQLTIPRFKENGLIPAINKFITDITASQKLHITFHYDNNTEIADEKKKITVFRIVQEQIKNILAHSKANNAEISIRRNEDAIEISIKDDGQGFDATETHRGIGLSGIYKRTKFYNGTAEIQTGKDKGCTLSVRIPC